MQKTITDYEREGWRRARCFACGGHGMVSAYTFDGSDFDGAKECDRCEGAGFVWRTPKGRYMRFPGARFC
jgi:hypothetical protein